ncbi:MAG: hypothetical protein ACTHM1_07320 [Solirubrobacteraceae bacterium]
MESSVLTRVLIVEHHTPITQPLLDAVHERASQGRCAFTLLIPNPAHGLHKVVDPQDQSANPASAEIERELPALRQAASGMPVDGMVGDADPVAAVEDAINLRGFDEIIVSAPSPRVSRWLKLDLPSKISGMGLPVHTVGGSRDAGAAHAGSAA